MEEGVEEGATELKIQDYPAERDPGKRGKIIILGTTLDDFLLI